MTRIDGRRAATQGYRSGDAANGQRRLRPTSRGSPEGRFLVSSGKPLNRQITELKDQMADSRVRDKECQSAMEHATTMVDERKAHHRGGDRPWLLRLLIPLAIVAEGLTAFVAMEVLVSSLSLAIGLAILAALVGAGTACIIANRRLNGLPVPVSARVLEGIFVGVLTLLRYDSLDVQSTGLVAAAGGAALAALISAIALLGIEEVVVETHTFSVFLGQMQASYRRWRHAQASRRLARLQAKVEAAGEKLQQRFLEFLLKAEGFPLDEARRRAEALKGAIVKGEAS
jgi:hypothetical protein